MAIKYGVKSMQASQERADEEFLSGTFIPYLRLKDDGDRARFWFVTEADEKAVEEGRAPHRLLNGYFHDIPKVSKRGVRFFKTILCSLDDEGVGQCDLCEQELARGLKFMVWVYVGGIYHKFQNTGEAKWPQRKLDRLTMYEEKYNKYMVWQAGYYMSQRLFDRVGRFGTLLDRPYELIRHGARNTRQVQYDLEYGEPKAIAAKIMEGAKELPSLEDIATGRIETMDGEESQRPSRQYEEVAAPEGDFMGDEDLPPGTDDYGDIPF